MLSLFDWDKDKAMIRCKGIGGTAGITEDDKAVQITEGLFVKDGIPVGDAYIAKARAVGKGTDTHGFRILGENRVAEETAGKGLLADGSQRIRQDEIGLRVDHSIVGIGNKPQIIDVVIYDVVLFVELLDGILAQ